MYNWWQRLSIFGEKRDIIVSVWKLYINDVGGKWGVNGNEKKVDKELKVTVTNVLTYTIMAHNDCLTTTHKSL